MADPEGKYFKCYCPCTDGHFKTVHLSPSNSRYEQNLRKWLERLPCWEEPHS